MYAHTHACVQQSLKEEAMSLKERVLKGRKGKRKMI